MRLLYDHGFYGVLLMHLQFALDEAIETAATDGMKIYFSPDFLQELNDRELDFVLMHEITHIVCDHVNREYGRDHERFNIACDIVVNSNILKSNRMDLSAITLRKYGVAMHLTPEGEEGYLYTAEEVYEMLPEGISAGAGGDGWDDHSRWGTFAEDENLKDLWEQRFKNACDMVSVMDPGRSDGPLPAFAERRYNALKKPQIDWRTILSEFVQEEVTDYSFTPPDRRFSEIPFFLPDFNDRDQSVCDILFMIDTSASMSDEMITAAYSEVKGALDQFGGKLAGWLGFFDAAVVPPVPFSDEEDLSLIRPKGGGGTRFDIIFSYVFQEMENHLPVSIIILTDGYAKVPPEEAAGGIPVLWLMNNDLVTPGWGKVARIKIDGER